MSTLGERIRKIRGSMSQEKFGDMLGVNRTTVGSWEIGRHEPDLDLLIKIAQFGNVSMDWLTGFITDKDFEQERLYRDPKWHPLISFAEQYQLNPSKIIKLLKATQEFHQSN